VCEILRDFFDIQIRSADNYLRLLSIFKNQLSLKNEKFMEFLDINLDYSFFNYPVFYQQQNGFLVFICHDLNLSLVTELPFRGRFNSKYAVKLASAMVKMEMKIKERVAFLKRNNKKIPKVSRIKDVTDSKKIKKLTAPQVADLLGVSKDTVRRRADSGQLPCFKTKGGTRYFLEKDILDFI
jgi:excisionase family DNA binding protein